jgi:hypothetical protein
MQFEQKTITILDEERHSIQVTAWQAVGTGLAYHHPIYKDLPSGAEYILVHAHTGMGITRLTLPTEPEAQAFLEAVAQLDPDRWNFGKEEYMRRYYKTGRVHELRAGVEMAHYNALIPRDEIFLYAEDADGDPVSPEVYDTESEDPEDVHNKECVAQFFDHYNSAVRVVLTRMDAKTGKHTDLHTYERSTAVEVRK